MDYRLEQIDELRGYLKETKSKVAAFVGAGCSSVLRIPRWDDMLIALNREFDYYPGDAEVIAAIRAEDYPKVAANIRRKAGDPKKYFETIRRYSTPTACYYTSLHIEIVHLTKTLVTTNYDHAFEDALETLRRYTKNPDYDFISYNVGEFDIAGLHTERRIFHLHGDKDGGNLVLDEGSYDDQYGEDLSDPANLLTSLYKGFNLVFIGYSFRDSYVVDYLKKLATRLQKPGLRTKPLPTHFCIMSELDYVHFCTRSELWDRGFLNVQELIDAGILTEENGEPGQPPNFVFAADAVDRIIDGNFTDEQQGRLRDLLFRTTEAVKRHEEFTQIGIKPILFKGRDFMRIETILQNLIKEDKPFAKKFDPNNQNN